MRPATLPLVLRRACRGAWVSALVDSGSAAVIGAIVAAGIALWTGWPPAISAAIIAIASAGVAWRTPPSLAQAATKLDQQFDLHDLLASAWAERDRLNQSWAATLWSIANTKAATLPPSPWPGRFSPRQHACGLAMAAALLLTSVLINPSTPGQTTAAGIGTATASPRETPVLTIAATPRRASDTADSPMRAFDAADAERHPAGTRSGDHATSPADDATGTGRADADRLTSLPSSAATSSGPPSQAGPGGSGQADGGPASIGTTRGEVVQTPADGLVVAPEAGPSTAGTAAIRRSTAIPTPPAYRELIQDYFAR